MGNLNPIFKPNIQQQPAKPKTIDGSTSIPLPDASEKAPRQMRSDKKDDVKFPVTDDMWNMLTWGYRRYKKLHPKEEIFQTGYNSKLMEKALALDPSSFAEVEYKDTKVYKHVKLIQFYSDKLFDLQLLWKCSEREAAFRVMWNILKKGELL